MNITTIRQEHEEIKRGMRRSWPQIGALLCNVEKSGYWKQDASSFTRWMTAHAADFNLKPTVLWAHYRMVRYYRLTLLAKARQWGIPAPVEVTELPDFVKCELMELYSRIATLAPDDVKRPLAVKVLNGSARRSELRAIWFAYRSQGMLDLGKSGRISAEKQARAREHGGELFEPKLLAALTSDMEWSNSKPGKPVTYKLIQHVTVDLTEETDLSSIEQNRKSRKQHRDVDLITFDIILLVKYANQNLRIHGIDILSSAPQYQILLNKSRFVDKMWVALPDNYVVRKEDNIPGAVGRIQVHDATVIVTDSLHSNAPPLNNLLLTARSALQKLA